MIIRARLKDVIILPDNDGEADLIKRIFKDQSAEFKFSFNIAELWKDWYANHTNEYKCKLNFIETVRDTD